jgi:hypothetical protein
VADNFIPIVQQIMLDYILDPDYVNLPRIKLQGFVPDRGIKSIAHMNLVNDIFSSGTLSIDDASGVCFRRVVWGTGMHVLYHDTVVAMRRLIADFVYEYVNSRYVKNVPETFRVQRSSNSNDVTKVSTTYNTSSQSFNQTLNVVIFSRGTSGKGRSMSGENLIQSALESLGANVMLCCDFSTTTLETQLSLAAHADVVRININLYCVYV